MNERVSRQSGSGRVLLLGASGQIGIFAIPRLVAAGFEVLAVSRKPRPDWYPRLKNVRWIKPDMPGAAPLPVADMLVSAGPIRIATQQVGQYPQLRHAVIFSTSSVFSKLKSHDRKEKRQMQQILMDEAALTRACEVRDITLSLYRPTMIYGCGIDGNISWLASWIRKFGFMPVAGAAAGLRQPVHADDLAQVVVATLMSEPPLALDVPLCGGSTLSFRALIEKIFHGLGKPERIVSVPQGLFTAATYLGRLVPGLREVRPEMVRRQSRDLVFDDGIAREMLNYNPRPFEPGPEAFVLPATAALKRLAER